MGVAARRSGDGYCRCTYINNLCSRRGVRPRNCHDSYRRHTDGCASVATVSLFVEMKQDTDIPSVTPWSSKHGCGSVYTSDWEREARRQRRPGRACLRRTTCGARWAGRAHSRALFGCSLSRDVRVPTLQISRTTALKVGGILGNAWEPRLNLIHCTFWERRGFVAPHGVSPVAGYMECRGARATILLTFPLSEGEGRTLSGRRGHGGEKVVRQTCHIRSYPTVLW